MIDLEKAAQGDKKAFDDIIALYNEKVIKIASIYVGDNFADVAQDVWIKIFEKKHLLSNVKNFDNWLFLVVRNTSFNYMKTEKRKRKHFGLPLHENINYVDSQVSYPNLLDKIIRDESIEVVRSIVKNLPEAYSLPLLMHYSKGMTVPEISKALNLPVLTVKWRIHAGKLQIKKEYKKGGCYE